MPRDYVSMSFKSLPKKIRMAITDEMELSEFEALVRQIKYSVASRKAGLHHYKKINTPAALPSKATTQHFRNSI